MKTLFKIFTPYGDCYLINESGQICKPKNVGTYYGFSDTWRMQGLSHVKRNEFIPFSKITKDIISTLSLTYKNGHPQYTVRDLDHGTTREWGNTKYHGVKSIYFL